MSRKSSVLRYVVLRPEIAIVPSMVVIYAFFSVLNPSFATWTAATIFLTVGAELGLVAIGEAFLIISGEFDLSVGAVYALAPMIVLLFYNAGFDISVGVVVALLVSLAVGFTNGMITLRARIPSFIATLGMMFLIRGILLLITGGFPIMYKGPEHPVLCILGGVIVGGVRATVVWFILATIILTIVLELTPYGNATYACGGNPVVAEELGINVKGVKLRNFILCSFLAGLSGCITLDRIKMSEPLLGVGMELEAIAASVVGGCLLTGGYGSIIGAALAAVMIAMIRTGMAIAGIPVYWYRAVLGILLLIATLVNKRVTAIIMARR